MTRLLRYAVLALLLTPGSVAAQDFRHASDAYKAGDYETALREWRPLAEQGDVVAQSILGLSY